MPYAYRVILVSVLILFSSLSAVALAAEKQSQPRAKRVLILNSYHRGYTFSDDEMRGIDDVFAASNIPTESYFEYMDTKRIHDQGYLDEFFRILKIKYARVIPDLIMLADNDALDFMLRYRKEFYENVPLVFEGINDFSDSLLAGQAKITGVIEASEYLANIELAQKLIPDLRSVVVVTDSTTTGLAHLEGVKKIEAKVKGIVEIVYLPFSEMLIEDVEAKLASLKRNSAVFLLSHFVDSSGEVYPFKSSLTRICKASRVPVFVATDTRIGFGALGGKVVSGYYQGETAAKLALRVLAGEPMENVKLVKQSPNPYMFDYAVLQRFRIALGALPPDSIIINRPYSFYREHKKEVVLVLGSMIALVLIVCLLAINILKRKRAEAALIASEARNGALINAMPDMIALNTADGTYLDFHVPEPFGTVVNKENPIGSNFREVMPAEVLEVFEPAFEEVRKTAQVVVVKFAVMINGQKRYRESRIVPCGENILTIARDVTVETKLQAELERAAKLESIGVLAAGIAHDFNNLLASILGNSGLAQAVLETGDLKKAILFLQEVEKASLRARELTQQLLTFARGGSPVVSLVAMPELIKEAASFALTGSQHRCVFELKNTWPVKADPGQISQVFNNLLLNAAQAMLVPGDITIETQDVNISAESGLPLKEGPYVKTVVTDKGVGIPAEVLSKVFDPFFTTKKFGTGLGLTSAYSIVKAHAGHISVESSLGKGSVFTIYLPATPESAAQQGNHISGIVRTRKLSVLIMDDEQMIRQMLSDALRALGHEAKAVANGQEAIDEYERTFREGKRFDMVILDLTVPGSIGGKDVAKKLNEIDATVCAVASSGYATDPVMSRCSEYGFAATLAKPYRISDLSEVLVNLFYEKKN